MVIMEVPQSAYHGYRDRVSGMGIRLVSEPGEGHGDTGGIRLHPKDPAKAPANAKAAGCRTGEDLITICGMRLRLV